MTRPSIVGEQVLVHRGADRFHATVARAWWRGEALTRVDLEGFGVHDVAGHTRPGEVRDEEWVVVIAVERVREVLDAAPDAPLPEGAPPPPPPAVLVVSVPAAAASPIQRGKGPRACRQCGREGHNRRTCTAPGYLERAVVA